MRNTSLTTNHINRWCRTGFAVVVLAVAVPVAAGAAWATTKGVLKDSEKLEEDLKENLPERVSFFSKLFKPDRRFLIVPIPQSNPTIGSGVILTAIYFHRQSEEDAELGLPVSSTQGALLYASSDSYGGVVQHQGFYAKDRWRVEVLAGATDLKLDFFGVGDALGLKNQSVRWNLKGAIFQPKLFRRLMGNWFAGAEARLLATENEFIVNFDFLGTGQREEIPLGEFDQTSMGLGPLLRRDTRDNRFNAYRGSYFEFEGLFNDTAIGSDTTYQAYMVRYRAYHALRENLIVAADGRARFTGGKIPFYDFSRLELRGFSATRYMDNHVLQFQSEIRWRFYKRLGLVGFFGGGTVAPELDEFDNGTFVWSGGGGLRFMLTEKSRINLRLDYGRTRDDGAFHLFVGEAF